MNKNSQSGFGVIEIILLIVMVGTIGFTGWRVYEAQKEIAQTPVDNSTVEKKKKDDTSKNFLTYNNKTLGITFSYPKDWVKVECDGKPNNVYFGSANAGVGMQADGSILCGPGSDFPPQMIFFITDDHSLYKEGTPTNVKVGGKEAKKYVFVSSDEGLYPAGFETTVYAVAVKDKMLYMIYNKWPKASEGYDTSVETKQKFIDLVEKSLRFL